MVPPKSTVSSPKAALGRDGERDGKQRMDKGQGQGQSRGQRLSQTQKSVSDQGQGQGQGQGPGPGPGPGQGPDQGKGQGLRQNPPRARPAAPSATDLALAESVKSQIEYYFSAQVRSVFDLRHSLIQSISAPLSMATPVTRCPSHVAHFNIKIENDTNAGLTCLRRIFVRTCISALKWMPRGQSLSKCY